MNINFEQEKKSLKDRKAEAHKGDFGHVCIIGAGHLGFAGAVCLAAEAALRAGAGLVSAIVHPSALPRMGAAPKEVMCYALEGVCEQTDELLEKATVIVLGPGLGQSPWALNLLNKVCEHKIPMVLDADGLNLLAHLPLAHRQDWILTPHPGEAARLLDMSISEVQKDRTQAIERLQEKWGGVIILKGAHTLVYTQGESVMECHAGNPGMASGGMGDILAGLIGGLLAQGLSLWSASKLGVMVHALAADRQEKEGQRGMLASDVLSEFRQLLN